LIYDAKFTFGPRLTIKFDFWPLVGKSLGTPDIDEQMIKLSLLNIQFLSSKALILNDMITDHNL